MSKPRFTPGPWCWEQCGDKCDAPVIGIAYLNSDTDCKNPLTGRLSDFDENGDEIEYYRETIAYEIQDCDGCSASSNAALMAAAPCLYAALERLLACSPPSEAADNAEKILAKARGESA